MQSCAIEPGPGLGYSAFARGLCHAMIRCLALSSPAITAALLAGCATTAPALPLATPATPVSVSAAPPDASTSPPPPEEADESPLPEAARARFASEKIEVFEQPEAKHGYGLKDGLGEVSEGAFLERYRKVVGAQDLPSDGARGTVPIVLGGLVLAAGLVGGVVILSSSSNGGSSCTQIPSNPSTGSPSTEVCPPNTAGSGPSSSTTAGLLLSGAALLGGGLIAVGLAANHHGQSLTRAQAEDYCDRYNRALLRKIAGEAVATP